MDNGEPNAKRTRSKGKRYPGASIPEVLELLRQIAAEAGSISTGLLATRLETTETSSVFKRLLASAKSYGFAEADKDNSAVVRLTNEGEAAVGDDPDRRSAALRRALVLPEVFSSIGRALSGKQMPSREGLIDRFKNVGVATSGAALAADNFLESAIEADAAPEEGQRRVLITDLPFEATAPSEARAVTGAGASIGKGARSSGGGSPKKETPPPPAAGTSAPAIDIRIDVSGWEVDKVVELIQKLKSVG